MADEKDLEKLARVKWKIKKLEETRKKTQEKILEDDPPEVYDSPDYGKLCLTTRENYKIPNNRRLLKNTGSNLTENDFIEKASMAPSLLRSLIGKNLFNKLVRRGVIESHEEIQYYQLKPHKE